jgi:hypothetical protein
MENPEQSSERLRSATEKLKSMYRLSKQSVANILFVSQGLKPTTEAEMLFKENTKGDPREEFEANIEELKQVLSDLNLVFEERRGHDDDVDMESIRFLIAQNEDMKEELLKAADMPFSKERDRAIGKVYGIPETAIDAFIKGRDYVAGREDIPEEIWNSKEIRIASFLPSKDHWREELEQVREKMRKIDAVLPGYFENL